MNRWIVYCTEDDVKARVYPGTWASLPDDTSLEAVVYAETSEEALAAFCFAAADPPEPVPKPRRDKRFPPVWKPGPDVVDRPIVVLLGRWVAF